MFTEENITKIFSNIEQIYEFHQEILRQLEECFVEEDPCASEIGSVFLNNVSFVCSLYDCKLLTMESLFSGSKFYLQPAKRTGIV